VAHDGVIGALTLIQELWHHLLLKFGPQLAQTVGTPETLSVLLQKPVLFQVLDLRGVDTILAVVDLDKAAIIIPHTQVILHDQSLEMLDQTALQVTTSTRLHGRIDQSFTPSHAMEEELLGTQTSQETVTDVPASPWIRIVGQE
jgi:hypothetical protein